MWFDIPYNDYTHKEVWKYDERKDEGYCKAVR
jgi:alpha-N-acetylglucosamine transferase